MQRVDIAAVTSNTALSHRLFGQFLLDRPRSRPVAVEKRGEVTSVNSGPAAIANPTSVMFDDDHASKALGIELLEAADGHALTRMRITGQMVNGHSIAHGGYVFLLADTAFACACNSHGPVTVAAGAEITFVAPGYEDDLLYARAEERTRFGRSGIYDITVHRDDERGPVVAEFRGHSRSMKSEGKTSHG